MTRAPCAEDAAGQLRRSACGPVFLFPAQHTSSTGLRRYRTSCWKFSSSRELCSSRAPCGFPLPKAVWSARDRHSSGRTLVSQERWLPRGSSLGFSGHGFVLPWQSGPCRPCRPGAVKAAEGEPSKGGAAAGQVRSPLTHCGCVQRISGPGSYLESRGRYLAECRGWKSGGSKARRVITRLSGLCAVRLMPGRSMSETFH